MKKQNALVVTLFVAILLVYCDQKQVDNRKEKMTPVEDSEQYLINNWDGNGVFEIEITTTGRYNLSLTAEPNTRDTFWLEDYMDNKNGRSYNISGNMLFDEEGQSQIDGSPLAAGMHKMRLNGKNLNNLKQLEFNLTQTFKETTEVLEQSMDGEKWNLKWSDEFEGEGLIDETKWLYNVGNWGWGNNELQYYTANNTHNARQENGNLIIEAHPVEGTEHWTSARLTTQSKVTFLYGKIEFRAKIPIGLGIWAAGWLLGDAYQDELSWPFCGEIDVLECVGYEMDDDGNGVNHASCHTPAYYFKNGNHITNTIEIDSMNTKFHTYAIEWYPDRVEAYLDGEHYYTYDKIANELEWPFAEPQNIVVNLAIGGGWGGLKGVDQAMGSQQFILDYIRVYEKI